MLRVSYDQLYKDDLEIECGNFVTTVWFRTLWLLLFNIIKYFIIIIIITLEPQRYKPLGKWGVHNSEKYVTLKKTSFNFETQLLCTLECFLSELDNVALPAAPLAVHLSFRQLESADSAASENFSIFLSSVLMCETFKYQASS